MNNLIQIGRHIINKEEIIYISPRDRLRPETGSIIKMKNYEEIVVLATTEQIFQVIKESLDD